MTWFKDLKPGDVVFFDIQNASEDLRHPIVITKAPVYCELPGTGSGGFGYQAVGLYPDGLLGRVIWYTSWGLSENKWKRYEG